MSHVRFAARRDCNGWMRNGDRKAAGGRGEGGKGEMIHKHGAPEAGAGASMCYLFCYVWPALSAAAITWMLTTSPRHQNGNDTELENALFENGQNLRPASQTASVYAIVRGYLYVSPSECIRPEAESKYAICFLLMFAKCILNQYIFVVWQFENQTLQISAVRIYWWMCHLPLPSISTNNGWTRRKEN